jgi:hypothetical protein
MSRPLQPSDYQHTRVLGFSVTRSIWDAFYAAIPNPSAWELVWYSGGSIDVWADPNSHAWTSRTLDNSGFLVPSDPGGQGGLINGISHSQDPTVGTSAIDRVIINISGLAAGAADPVMSGYNGGTRPDLGITGSTTGFPPGGFNGTVATWKAYIDAAVANVRSKYPNVRMILLQPNIAGPSGGSQSACTTADSNAAGYGVVRSTYTSPYIRSAIAAATRANVRGGFGAFATDCTDFAEWAGHLNTTPQTTHGQAMAAYYAAHL